MEINTSTDSFCILFCFANVLFPSPGLCRPVVAAAVASSGARDRRVHVGYHQRRQVDVPTEPARGSPPYLNVAQRQALQAILRESLDPARHSRRNDVDVLNRHVPKQRHSPAAGRWLFSVGESQQQGRSRCGGVHPRGGSDLPHGNPPDGDVFHGTGVVPVALELDGPRARDLCITSWSTVQYSAETIAVSIRGSLHVQSFSLLRAYRFGIADCAVLKENVVDAPKGRRSNAPVPAHDPEVAHGNVPCLGHFLAVVCALWERYGGKGSSSGDGASGMNANTNTE
mmetsp:Transcript_12328/g.28922  ORF Transcript_12328/g.28922 Transcript_12328/m.28922 type:complete len:284 (-) Transcript_12328:8-859(-)